MDKLGASSDVDFVVHPSPPTDLLPLLIIDTS